MGDGGTNCIKNLVFFFNFLFFIFGITLLGFGIYAQVAFGDYASLSSVDYVTGSRLMIAVGAIIATISFFGCCGAWNLNKCMLIIFLVLLLIMLGLEIGVAVLGYKYKEKIEDNIVKDIKRAIDERNNDRAVFQMQKELNCCGANGTSDWKTTGNHTLPDSCKCRPNENCKKGQIYYEEGCADALKKFLHDKLLVISALAITLLVIQILGMVFAFILIRRVDKGTYA